MQAANSWIKILTLSFFACLLIGFVAYKSGFFEEAEEIEKSTMDAYPMNASDLDSLPDSLVRKHDPSLIPSSKSGKPFAPVDMGVSENENDSELIPSSKSGMPFTPEVKKKKKKMMSSSKSFGVFEEEEVDTIEKDSFLLIPSSKSTAIFEPQEQNQSPK